ncbi:hypothetical protein HQ585_06120 [candidate division KSB1 bacterium]|nr:hypothetical protein [candidate division KSB1 bacterium]
MRRFTLILLVFLMMIPFLAQGQGCMEASSEEGVSVMGFFQPQFEYLQETEEMTFDFNRARIGLVGNVPYDISYYMFVEYSPSKGEHPYLLDAFITYSRLAPYFKISMGQFKAPFSLERNTGCSALHTINRSMVVNQLAMDRDMGVMLMGNVKEKVKYNVALMNGTGVGLRDDNEGEDITGRIVFSPTKCLDIGGSFRFGSAKAAVANADDDERKAFGGDVSFKKGDLLVQGEYIQREDIGSYTTGGGCGEPLEIHEGSVKRNGYFVQALYMLPFSLQPVVKYETFDQNIDVENDQRSIITFGFNYFLNEWTRLQVNYRYCAEADNVEIDNDQVLVQAQVIIQ